MSEPQPAVARGRSFLADLLRMAQTRLEILSVELEQEKIRITRMLRAVLLTAICAWLAGFTLILWVALALGPGVRLIVLGALFAALCALTLGGWLAVRRSLRDHPPFSRLIDALRLDRASLGQEP